MSIKGKLLSVIFFYSGQVPSEAEGNFLKKACTLDTYGVDPHPVKVSITLVYSFGDIFKARAPQSLPKCAHMLVHKSMEKGSIF